MNDIHCAYTDDLHSVDTRRPFSLDVFVVVDRNHVTVRRLCTVYSVRLQSTRFTWNEWRHKWIVILGDFHLFIQEKIEKHCLKNVVLILTITNREEFIPLSKESNLPFIIVFDLIRNFFFQFLLWTICKRGDWHCNQKWPIIEMTIAN